jgi:hypothetical protein
MGWKYAAERREARKLVVFCKVFRVDADGYTRFGVAVPSGLGLGHRGFFFPLGLSAAARHARASDSSDPACP